MIVHIAGGNEESWTYDEQLPLPALPILSSRSIQRRQVRPHFLLHPPYLVVLTPFGRSIKKLKTFPDIMAALGVNKEAVGCEICKPAIGSILSSLWNEHIMNPVHHAYVVLSSSVSYCA